MHKGVLLIITAILASFILVGAACADYGYTNVSQIPMAVDFSVRVDLAAHISGFFIGLVTYVLLTTTEKKETAEQ